MIPWIGALQPDDFERHGNLVIDTLGSYFIGDIMMGVVVSDLSRTGWGDLAWNSVHLKNFKRE